MSKKFLFCWIIGTLILFSILFMISGVNAQPTDNDEPKPRLKKENERLRRGMVYFHLGGKGKK
jgi:uncharacterized membrane protein